MKKIDRTDIIGYVLLGLIIFVGMCMVAEYAYDCFTQISFEDSICMVCGYEQATDKTTISGTHSKPSYDVVECDNHFQTAVFNTIVIIDKGNKSKWLNKIVVNCGDYRFNQNAPNNYLPIVTHPNDCFDLDPHNCFIDGYIGP